MKGASEVTSKNWPLVPLGELLEKRAEKPKVDPDAEYSRLTVAVRGRGLRVRDVVAGRELGTAKFVARSGDLVISKIDARNGAAGLVPVALDGVVVTADFPIYKVDYSRVLPEYMDLFVRSREFASMCKDASGGTTNRVRLDMKRFPALTIPLPPLETQKKTVEVVQIIEDAIHSAQVEFAAGVAALRALREGVISRLRVDGTPWGPLESVLKDVRRPLAVEAETIYTQIGVRSHGKGIFIKEPVTGADLGDKKMLTVKAGDLVLNVVFAWEGAVAVVPESADGLASSHRFPTFRRVDGASVALLRHFFLTPEGLLLLQQASPGGAGRNKTLNRKQLLAMSVPQVAPTTNDLLGEMLDTAEHLTLALSHQVTLLHSLKSAVMSGMVFDPLPARALGNALTAMTNAA